ncbi:acyl--CoA ligase [Lysinibacillus sp. FSL H8-0500]|uniref:acyl-CoA synthetase MbcS n=1 Tax=Lysinibacillus sp. FSL H8-0500 TaxID=2921393 RepID=UPI003100FF7F
MKRQDLIAPEWYNITEEIEKYAQDTTKNALIICDEHQEVQWITYTHLLERANQAAHVFTKQGLTKGDVILVMVPRSVEAYIVYIAALKAGLTIIPSSEMLRTKDIDYRIQHANVQAIIAYEPYIEQFDKVENLQGIQQFVIGNAHEPWQPLLENMQYQSTTYINPTPTKSTDIAFLAYTSGTTGNPKAAVHSHSWGYAHLRTSAPYWLGVQENDIVWATAAPGWQKWIWSPFLATLGSGATAFVYKGKFDAATYLTLLEKFNINVLCCTPTEYRFMAALDHLQRYNLSAVRQAVSAGEPLNSEVIKVFSDVCHVQIRDGYGQTENTLLVGTMVGMETRAGSMGKPTPGNTVDIINDEGQPVAVGEVGDIAVHRATPALFKKYLKDPERTHLQFRGDWYITGDRAYKDKDGYFWFEGRGDDVIISSGYTIGPFEVEDALMKHPTVKEAAVIASPDKVRGNIVKAFIVLHQGEIGDQQLMQTLQQHVKTLTAPYKYPRAIEFVEELPKTSSGKIRRVELRQQEAKQLEYTSFPRK